MLPHTPSCLRSNVTGQCTRFTSKVGHEATIPVVDPMMAHDAGSQTPFFVGSMKIRLRSTLTSDQQRPGRQTGLTGLTRGHTARRVKGTRAD
jgi:hypothetical protein